MVTGKPVVNIQEVVQVSIVDLLCVSKVMI